MNQSRTPLHHIVRVRRTEDLDFARPGLMDEIVVNANQLENSVQSTAAFLWKSALPFMVDPVLWRFQIPAWWRNAKGDTKRNYTRLGSAYAKGTNVRIAEGPLVDAVPSDKEWRGIAANILEYERSRLRAVPTQLDLFDATEPRELRPVRLMAPALVAYSTIEDRINRLLLEASIAVAGEAVAAQLVVPPERLVDHSELQRLMSTVPTDGVSSCFIWTPEVTEDQLIADPRILVAILQLVSALASRGVPVGHQYANYSIAALHDVGIAAVIHHLGWVDKGEPAADQGFMIRSCQTYVPGVRHSVRFRQAAELGHGLDAVEYVERYCDCAFCVGTFDAGQHPLDLLLEDQTIELANGRQQRTPTGRAVAANTWHFLQSRRLEVQRFSVAPAIDVIREDIERAGLLADGRERERLKRLADHLRSA